MQLVSQSRSREAAASFLAYHAMRLPNDLVQNMLHASAYYVWSESTAVAKRVLRSSFDGHHHMPVLCCLSAIFTLSISRQA